MITKKKGERARKRLGLERSAFLQPSPYCHTLFICQDCEGIPADPYFVMRVPTGLNRRLTNLLGTSRSEIELVKPNNSTLEKYNILIGLYPVITISIKPERLS